MKQTIEFSKAGVDTLLGSLALLRMNVLSKDHISSFKPFIATLIVDNKYDVVDINIICEDFKKAYGFDIQRLPMVAILNECARDNIIHRENDGQYHVVNDNANRLCFTRDAQKKSQQYRKVVEDFCEYAKTEFDANISIEDGEEILFSFINENSSKTLMSTEIENLKPENMSKKHFFFIARYIEKIEKENIEIFSIIQDIATAHIICSSLIDELKHENTNILQGIYHSLVLYLDTPVVLKILGLNTVEMKESYLLLIEQLKERNNKLKIFQHTFDELHDILRDCEFWIENPLYKAKHASPALKTFVENMYTKNEVGLFREHLEEKLQAVGITVDKTDFYDPKYDYLQIDDNPIRKEIIDCYKENVPSFIYEEKKTTIERDVKSISAIFKLRRNKQYTNYKSAKYLFITTNTSLAYISKISTKIANPSYKYGVFPCITDIILGTDIWISTSVDKISTFSKKKLLADCSAAIQPDERLIDELSKSIEKLYSENRISEDDYYLLKTHAFRENYIVNRTYNDENVFSDRTTAEILEDIKLGIQAPLKDIISEKDNQIAKQSVQINKLHEMNKQKDMEKSLREQNELEKERNAEEHAEKVLNTINNTILVICVPAAALTISIIISIFLPYLDNCPKLKVIFSIISPIITFLSALENALLRNSTKLRAYVIKKLKNRKLISMYKQELK